VQRTRSFHALEAGKGWQTRAKKAHMDAIDVENKTWCINVQRIRTDRSLGIASIGSEAQAGGPAGQGPACLPGSVRGKRIDWVTGSHWTVDDGSCISGFGYAVVAERFTISPMCPTFFGVDIVHFRQAIEHWMSGVCFPGVNCKCVARLEADDCEREVRHSIRSSCPACTRPL